MKKAKKGDWVRIHSIILPPEQRALQVPEDTQNVSLEMWDKGYLLDEEAQIGQQVHIETYIGRNIQGELVEINPYYKHNYGKCIPEILYIGKQLREILLEGENNE